ncbi:GntR family transcriptional regulator [Arthrobacter sp. KN11-1C]|uniref:GntR family transcriptional regulator n=1 Tax=Arthrobacter sp. KN11-1C TaxID=3445774 RepID=UPI003F9FC13A
MTVTNALADSWASEPLGRPAMPVREQVVDRLRSAITGLQLKPGQRLVERELMERLGVSRTTVREAIRELSSEGLVTVVPQKGAIVSRPTGSEAEDLYEVRARLESLVVQRFIERASDDEISDLRKATANYRRVTEQHISDMRAALESLITQRSVGQATGTEYGATRLPSALHRTESAQNISDMRSVLAAKSGIYAVLIAGARSEALRVLMEQIQARVHVLRATSLSHPGRAMEAVEEMEAIAASVAKRDITQATELYEAHIRHAARTALADFDD